MKGQARHKKESLLFAALKASIQANCPQSNGQIELQYQLIFVPDRLINWIYKSTLGKY